MIKKILNYTLIFFCFFTILTYDVKADTVSDFSFLGHSIRSNFSVSSGSSLRGRTYVVVPSSLAKSYINVELCSTTGREISGWNDNIGGIGGYVGTDFTVIESGSSCAAGGYAGTIVNIYIKVVEWDDAGNGNYGVTFESVFVNNASWNGIYGITSITLSDTLDSSVGIYNQNDTIIDQNFTIIDQNNDTNNKLNEANSKLNEGNNKLNETNQHLGDLNDSLNNNDTSDASNEAGDFFSGFSTDTFGLTSIITAPLNLIGSITSSSCSPLGLQVPFVENATLNLPCMSTIYQNYFGSFLSIYQTITFGIVAYWVCVRIFALVKDFKNPDHDEIEVLDL